MSTYDSNQQFYDHIDQVIQSLRAADRVAIADKIHFLLHEAAWTTASELFGELRAQFEAALKSTPPMPSEIEIDLRGFIATIDGVEDGQ